MTTGSSGTVVAAARSRLGKPYRWAAAGPNAFDCSGLVQWCYARAGYGLPHQSAAQWATMRKRPLAHAQPGDVVFFGMPVHHCGIYVGDGQMIDAQQTGVPVAVHTIQRSGLHTSVGAFPGSTSSGGSAVASTTPVEQQILTYLTGLGFSSAGASAALGSFEVESNFDPTASNAREGAIGIAQWEGGRRTKLRAYASAHGGKETDLAMQLGYLGEELRSSYNGVYARMRKTTDAGAAAADWDAHFEVSSGAARGQRVANARSIYEQIQGGQVLTGGPKTATYTSDVVTGGAVSGILGGAAGNAVDSAINSVVGVVVKVAFTALGLVFVALGGAAAVRTQTPLGKL